MILLKHSVSNILYYCVVLFESFIKEQTLQNIIIRTQLHVIIETCFVIC